VCLNESVILAQKHTAIFDGSHATGRIQWQEPGPRIALHHSDPSVRVRVPLIAFCALAPATVSAQSSTADGVQAIIRGDSAAAIRILTPLAEDFGKPDPLAQFFLATALDSGRGAPLNRIRSCGLYLRAAVPGNPLAHQARTLAANTQELSALMSTMCTAASVWPWGAPITTRVTMAADRWVVIDPSGVTVGYQGQERRAPLGLGGPGYISLPVRHTALDVPAPREMHRDFIELFDWHPIDHSDAPTWALGWMLFEVVGADLVPITGDPSLTTVVASRPPATVDLETLVRVRVNGQGEAEWAVLRPSNPRSGVILQRSGGR
jgi:hypothetical protein